MQNTQLRKIPQRASPGSGGSSGPPEPKDGDKSLRKQVEGSLTFTAEKRNSSH